MAAAEKTPNVTVPTDLQKAGITGRRHTVAALARRRGRQGQCVCFAAVSEDLSGTDPNIDGTATNVGLGIDPHEQHFMSESRYWSCMHS